MASLKVGTWKINGNGFEHDLIIGSIDAQGVLANSTVFGNTAIGFWDESSRKVTFMRVTNAADPSSIQVYNGYLMKDNKTLAGSFEALQGSGGTAHQSVFGWFAKFP